MILILADLNDLPALWVYQQFNKRGLGRVEFISSEMLSYSKRWEHRVNNEGSTITFELCDGRIIDGRSVHGVLNRLTSIHFDHLLVGEVKDREYARCELAAFFTSWLHALPSPVLNPVSSQGLSGTLYSLAQWRNLARQANLPIVRFVQGCGSNGPTTDQNEISASVIVIGTRLFGTPLNSECSFGCFRLSQLSGLPVLGIRFAMDHQGIFAFDRATPLPDFRIAGYKAIDALLETFVQ